jgi:YlmC/YmxH family sporulation protein
MHNKEVINICDGMRLGCVDDVEVDTCTAQLVAIVVYGKGKLFGLLGRCDDIVIGWREIEVIGEETILVNHPMPTVRSHTRKNGCNILGGLFN